MMKVKSKQNLRYNNNNISSWQMKNPQVSKTMVL